MISPSLTITAPNGPPQPLSTDSIASRVASCMNLRCSGVGVVVAVAALAGAAGIPAAAATPAAATMAVRVKKARRCGSGSASQINRFMAHPLENVGVPALSRNALIQAYGFLFDLI